MFAADAPVTHVWHFWLAVPLAAAGVLLVLSILGLYLVRVTKTRYPNKQP